MEASVCFAVERVIGVSGEGDTKIYMVQWKPTWVHVNSLRGCEQLIQDFQTEKDQEDGIRW